ncbi:hypothetical protein [Microcoleus sp. K5-D4]|uniref:hypothetical protein n=1 Tax=Microcoleus sp. K5-D4 TaxID=2818801 RepID=UPI002FD713FE
MAIATTLQEAIALSDAGIRIKLGAAAEALLAVCGDEGKEVQASGEEKRGVRFFRHFRG